MADEFEIEVFRPGTFTPMKGNAVTYSAEDLSTVAEVYDAVNSPAPAVIGHPAIDAPAYGWASSFRYDAEAQRLFATVGDVVPAFAEALKAKNFRKVSMSFFPPDASANPKPGSWYPRHIGFLGGAAPAVPGLAPVAFAGPADEAVEVVAFGDIGFRDTAGLFRNLRDWIIETLGMEKADAVLPSYTIDWLSKRGDYDPSFSEPALLPNPEPKPVPTPNPPPVDFAARQTELENRERALAEREATGRNADHVAFCEGLVKEGRLLPRSKNEVVGLLNALAGAEKPASVSFADAAGAAKTEPATDVLKRLLKEMPVQVDFSALPREPAGGAAVSFAAPDGIAVDAAGRDLHAKAKAYQRQHPNTSWLVAVQAVS